MVSGGQLDRKDDDILPHAPSKGSAGLGRDDDVADAGVAAEEETTIFSARNVAMQKGAGTPEHEYLATIVAKIKSDCAALINVSFYKRLN